MQKLENCDNASLLNAHAATLLQHQKFNPKLPHSKHNIINSETKALQANKYNRRLPLNFLLNIHTFYTEQFCEEHNLK